MGGGFAPWKRSWRSWIGSRRKEDFDASAFHLISAFDLPILLVSSAVQPMSSMEEQRPLPGASKHGCCLNCFHYGFSSRRIQSTQ